MNTSFYDVDVCFCFVFLLHLDVNVFTSLPRFVS